MTELPPLVVWSLALPSFGLAAYYGWRAAKVDRFSVLAFVMIVGYALLIEANDIRTTHSYVYAKVLVMIGSPPGWVPLSICASWASIIFIAMTTSDRLGLPRLLRPWVDGLVAVSIDLVADPVMSNTRWVAALTESCADQTAPARGGIGVWTWCVPEADPATWLDVPVGNFVGWYLVVVAVSLGIRIARKRFGGDDTNVGVQALVLGVTGGLAAAAVFAGIRLYDAVPGFAWEAAWFGALILVPLAILVVHRRSLRTDGPLDKGLVLLPILSHIGALYTWFSTRIDADRWPEWSLLMIVAALASASLVLLPYRLRRRPPPA